MTAVTVTKYALALNALLDFALAYTGAGQAVQDSFPSLSAEGVRAINAGFPAHGLIRGFAALAIGSAEARRAAQLSYIGELLVVVGLRDKFDLKGGAAMIAIPTAMILALEYINQNQSAK
ncbi:hypothetical protein DFJ74DRAFT_686300 [Hyaloraphidium curvatum]|nr:hypothetical protein DFJ74DRAFT_686300 [Hyaloraphidium curvatum]